MTNLNITNFPVPETYYGFVFITYFPNGKVYVGQTIKRVEKKYYGSGGRELVEAIKHFGKENLKREILRFCFNNSNLSNWEHFFIVKRKACSYKGYNKLKSDKNFQKQNPMFIPCVRKRSSLSHQIFNKTEKGKEIIKRIASLNKGRKASKEWKENKAKEMKGNKFALGMKHTKKSRKKMSLKRKGKKKAEQHKTNIGLSNLGKRKNFKASKKTKLKMRLAQRKRFRKKSERDKMSFLTKGSKNPMSKENRLKRKIGQQNKSLLSIIIVTNKSIVI